MYAIAEFLKGSHREYAVVPIIWLHDNNKICYWPRVRTENELVKLVQENSPYNKNWPKYKVHRVIKTSKDHDSLQRNISELLEQSTTDSGSSAIMFKMITDRPSYEQEIATEDHDLSETAIKNHSKNKNLKRKHKSRRHEHKKSRSSKPQSSPKKTRQDSSSSSASTDSDDKENETLVENDIEFSTINDGFTIEKNRGSSIVRSNHSSHRSPTLLKNITNTELLASGSRNLPSASSPSFSRSITNQRLAALSSINSSTTPPSTPKSVTHKGLEGPIAMNSSPTSSTRSITNKGLEDLRVTNYPSPKSHRSTGETFQRQSSPSISITASPNRSRSDILSSEEFQVEVFPPKILSPEKFQVEVMTQFKTLTTEISQINVSLSQLARAAQLGRVETSVKPDDFPSLPIQTIADFRNFDQRLKSEVYETYFTNRLAAIGGVSVRQGVMNILKFAITNRVAMEFNWAGREKKFPFKVTRMAKIITAAVKIRFLDSPDSTDMNISSAIKDWLKQAKHREACAVKKGVNLLEQSG